MSRQKRYVFLRAAVIHEHRLSNLVAFLSQSGGPKPSTGLPRYRSGCRQSSTPSGAPLPGAPVFVPFSLSKSCPQPLPPHPQSQPCGIFSSVSHLCPAGLPLRRTLGMTLGSSSPQSPYLRPKCGVLWPRALTWSQAQRQPCGLSGGRASGGLGCTDFPLAGPQRASRLSHCLCCPSQVLGSHQTHALWPVEWERPDNLSRWKMK